MHRADTHLQYRRWLAVWALFVTLCVGAWPVHAEDRPRTDLYGDPLPEGAVARLGSVRWQHPSNVSFIAYTNGDKELLTSCRDGWVHVWNVETGKKVRRLGDGQNPEGAFEIAVTADGKTLATAGGQDGKIHLWDIALGKELRSFAHGHSDIVGEMAFTADGKTLITRGGQQDGVFKLWDPATGKLGREFSEVKKGGKNLRSAIGSIVVAPDGKLLAATAIEFDNGVQTSTVRIWSVADGKEQKTIKDPSGGARGFSLLDAVFAPDGKSLAWVLADGSIRLFDVSSGKELRKLQNPGGEDESAAFIRAIHSADGKTLAALDAEGTIALFEISTGKKLKAIGDNAEGASGKRAPGALRRTYLNAVGPLALSPDGKSVAQGWGNAVRLWNLETGKPSNDLSGGHRGPIQGAMVSPDGETAVTVGADQAALRWDLASGKLLHRGKLPPDTFSPLLITTSRAVLRGDGCIRVWDVVAGKESVKLAGIGDSYLVAASFDGKFSAISTQDQIVHVHSLETGKEIRTFKGAQSGENFPGNLQSMVGLDITPDGTGVAIQTQNVDGTGTSVSNTVRMYDVRSGAPLWEAAVPGASRWFNFSNDGHSLAIIMPNRTVLLDVATGKERGHFDVAGSCLMFSDDGHFMAVTTLQPGAFDNGLGRRFDPQGSIKLFDVRTGKELATFDGNQGYVSWLTFTPDAGLLLSAGSDGTTLVWDTRELVRKAQTIRELDGEAAKKLWTDLGEDDAVKAFQAVAALIASPRQALSLAALQLKPARNVDSARVNKLIVELDNDEFEVRKKAFDDLARMGGRAAPLMKKALEGDLSAEVRRQLEQLLDRAKSAFASLTPDTRRDLRAIEVLELIGTPEVRTILEPLAKGADGTRVTTEAAAALKRMAK